MNTKKLFSKEMRIQSLDEEIKEYRLKWMQNGAKVRSLSQEKSALIKELREIISKG